MNTEPRAMSNGESPGSDAATGLESELPEEGEISAPFDPAKIDVVTQVRTIDLLLARLTEGELDLSPDFQRRSNLWNDVRKSRLIESLLLRIPIPSLYVSEDSEGIYSVVDGLQRMCAIAHFARVDALNVAVGGKLPSLRLRGLQSLTDYEGRSFKDLPRPLQRRINETELTLHVIRASTPPEVKFNIFSRINQGGLPLSAQELRNAIFPGVWRSWISRFSQSQEFLEATERKIRGERMEDVELVLRFLAAYSLRAPVRDPDQNLDEFLNEFVSVQCVHWNEQKWLDARDAFSKAMKFAIRVFGRNAFRKTPSLTAPRRPINRGLFEAQAVVLAWRSIDELNTLWDRRDAVQRQVLALNQDSGFMGTLLYATGRGSSSNRRIERLHAVLTEVLNA